MSEDRNFRIDEFDIEELIDRRYSVELVNAARDWLPRIAELDAAIEELKAAFGQTTLGDGIGLYEACGIDDYACEEELKRLRALDEKEDWSRIPVERMEHCSSAPNLMDAEGFVFHLPAFLIAELNDQHPYGFIDRMINPERSSQSWVQRLTVQQRSALADVLEVVSHHPEYKVDPVRPENPALIRAAIEALRQS